MATVETPTLLTAEEYLTMPDSGERSELVRGRIETMNMPGFRHGKVCVRIAVILTKYADLHDVGQVVGNDSGVQTEHDPDTVRGADVAFYSYARLPRGTVPQGYPEVAPEIVFEVRSPWDRWREIQGKVSEYLNANVLAVCVLDPATETLTLYRADEGPQTLQGGQELTFPGILDEFRVAVREFFE